MILDVFNVGLLARCAVQLLFFGGRLRGLRVALGHEFCLVCWVEFFGLLLHLPLLRALHERLALFGSQCGAVVFAVPGLGLVVGLLNHSIKCHLAPLLAGRSDADLLAGLG